MIDYTILVPRCQAFYSKIFLYFLSSQFFPFGFPERRCAAPSPNADTKTRLPLAPYLQHSRTASLPPARKPQRGQTANSPCGAGRKGSTLSHRSRRRARPPLREVPTAGHRRSTPPIYSRTASLPPARKPQRGQTTNSPCGAGRKGSTLSHRGRRRARPPLREVPTAGPRSASRLSLVI